MRRNPPRRRSGPPPAPGRGRAAIAASGLLLASLLAGGADPSHPPAPPVSAAARPHLPRGAARPDSQELRREAERRQRKFEERRRSHLETTWGRPVTRCDEVVGRFCLWHGEDEGWKPPPEPPAVTEARRELLAVLDSAHRRIPGDPWIAGQRVRYLLGAERTGRALEAARACRAAAWWCRALEGLVHHRAGRHREAERAYGLALDAMGESRACRWRDLTDLLEGELRDRFEERSCDGRTALARRVWWLADPLYLVPGNERRAEHFSRRVLDRTQRDAETPSGVGWGEDLQDLLVRYGWPVGWERDVSTDAPGASVISHYPDPARRWMPAEWEHVERSGSIPAGAWPDDPSEPTSEYAPARVRAYGRLQTRVSRFRRADSSLVVAAYRLAPAAADPGAGDADSIRIGGWVRAGLYLDPGPGEARASTTTRTQGRRGVLAVRSGTGGRLLSVETLAPADSVAARLRRGLRLRPLPEEGMAISDLLLVEPDGDSVPSRLRAVVPRAVAREARAAGSRVGLYWEVYGEAGAGRRVRTAVTLAREGGGFLGAVGDFLGLGGGDREAVRVEWTGRLASAGRVHPRSLVIRLPEGLPADEYLLRIRASRTDGDTAVASRRIRVRQGR